MARQKNNNKKLIKPIDPIEHYLNIDDDEKSTFRAALFRETLGFSIDDVLDSDDGDDDIEETNTTEGEDND